MYFVNGDFAMGQHAFARAYLNFVNQQDLFDFTNTFDGYVFLDTKGDFSFFKWNIWQTDYSQNLVYNSTLPAFLFSPLGKDKQFIHYPRRLGGMFKFYLIIA
jgi:hypothetical protein